MKTTTFLAIAAVEGVIAIILAAVAGLCFYLIASIIADAI
jgi:hypothetical protein